ncbi:shikimate kinase [Syntrophotalea acetylenivorans]|uniref:Shikimate kinase n=1 Tax=Syntrophotalea acetylenivorans TaxID=1842532 RepID=A0A1L3GQD9_9BACT|nr:shikimate kinase [Syntrophotalea acetylenivorans]APG28115.1 shikimate kinase [Syntrophotalea acetylenivorans]
MTMEKRSNIALVGMPGSGKSTVGLILAEELSRDFVDTDSLIESSQGRKLQHIVDMDGYAELRRIEENILLDLHVQNHIIATGGSVVYSQRGMTHLQSISIIVFLNVELSDLRSRIHNYDSRGIAKRPEQSFEDLFRERFELYTRYADITIDGAGLSKEEVCNRVLQAIKN